MEIEKQIEEMANDIFSLIRSENLSLSLASLLHHKGYRKATDVAREIFEEIERFLYMHFRICKEEIGNDKTNYVKGRLELNSQIEALIAELKKKYTEGDG